MRIGDVAEQAGVNVETLRYYERRGLLPAPVRSPGGHRDYDVDTVRFVRAVKEAQILGFSLSEIEEYMALTRRALRVESPEEARSRLTGKLAEIDRQARRPAPDARRCGARAVRALETRSTNSTSTAAYIARGGREPVGEPLHVTNGESAASTLRETVDRGGRALVGRRTTRRPARVRPAESRRVRSQFLAEQGWGDAAAIEVGARASRRAARARRSASSSGSSPTSSTSCSSSRFWRRFRREHPSNSFRRRLSRRDGRGGARGALARPHPSGRRDCRGRA